MSPTLSEGNAEGVIHIHEDDWGMRNLYPLVAQAEVSADLEASIAAGEKNRDPSDFGWTDVYVIKPPSTSYIEAGLLLSDAAAALEPIMPRVRHFYATTFSAMGKAIGDDPYGSYEDDAWCFGISERCFVKLDTKGEHVERIWFNFWRDTAEHATALKQAIAAINRLVPSLIVDYFLDASVPVSDVELLDRYFASLTE